MVEYWGAQAFYSSGGPNGPSRYVQQTPDPDFQFTAPADSEGNGTTIETVYRQIMNQHPEDISALADQWQNAYNLMSSIRQQLLKQGTALHDEHWKSADARDAFLEAGPGKTLAYLDEWMTSASNNVTALRAIVGIVIQSRTDMTNLWNEYKSAVHDAKTLDGGERTKTFFQVWKSWSDADRDEAMNDLRHTQDEYNQKARQLAYRVAGEYNDTISKVSSGFGPPFVPMDAVINPVGHPPYTPPPGAPPVTAPPTAPPAVGKPPALTKAPAPDPNKLQQKVLNSLKKPPLPDLPTPPAVTPSPVPAPGLSPGQVTLPPGYAGLGAPPPPGLGSSRIPGNEAGAPGVRSPSAFGKPGTPPQSGNAFRNGVLGRGTPGAPGAGAGEPPATLRSPKAPPPAMPPRGQSRKPPASRGADGDRVRNPLSPETEDAFSRPPGSTAPPVLNNRKPGQRRPGSREELTPFQGRTGTPSPIRPDAAPPVLNSPGSNPAQPPAMPGRPSRGKVTQGPARPQPPGTDWTGLEEIRAEASSPVLDTPAPPARGAAVSGLEEVPKALRGTAATAAGKSARPDTVAPELSTRRTTSDAATGAQGGVPDLGDEGQKIVTDEDAFSVETPGGGVLGKQPEDRSYRAEPPTVLGGN